MDQLNQDPANPGYVTYVQPIDVDPGDPGTPPPPGPPPPPSGYGTAIFTTAVTKLDAASALDIMVYLNCYSPDDLRFGCYIFIDDTLVQAGNYNLIFDQANSQAASTVTMLTIQDGVAAGAHTIGVRIKNLENEATLYVQGGSIIKITEMRQAGR